MRVRLRLNYAYTKIMYTNYRIVSPINGIGLIPITNKIFLDQATNSYFIMKENKLTLVPIEEIENLNIQTKQHKTK